MTLPALSFSRGCCGKIPDPTTTKSGSTWFKMAIVTDAILFISALVISILGLTSTIAIPQAMAYSLVAVPICISLAWLAMLVLQQ